MRKLTKINLLNIYLNALISFENYIYYYIICYIAFVIFIFLIKGML